MLERTTLSAVIALRVASGVVANSYYGSVQAKTTIGNLKVF